jgi:DNA-binding CsgD family transcriptional regulator
VRNDLVAAYQRVVDLATAILDHPRPELPTSLITAELAACLPSTIAFGFDLRAGVAQISGIIRDGDDLGPVHTMLSVCGVHPLFHHYRTTGTRDVADARILLGDLTWRHSEIYAVSRTLLDVTQHVTIPIPGPPGALRGFSLGRDGAGYTEDELDLARRVQKLLTGIDRHHRAYRHWHDSVEGPAAADIAEDLHLTPRELTVLGLLAQARTAQSIGRRLGISYRTVNKHLENLYRKLGTADRLTTIQRAHHLGLLRDTWVTS